MREIVVELKAPINVLCLEGKLHALSVLERGRHTLQKVEHRHKEWWVKIGRQLRGLSGARWEKHIEEGRVRVISSSKTVQGERKEGHECLNSCC